MMNKRNYPNFNYRNRVRMREHIKAEDWLPQGWKIEIRVRKTGKKDRYYIDPTNGYIFRSLKDIDRYLLTGKLGRHVTKTKPKEFDDSDVKLDIKLNTLRREALKRKKWRKSNGMKKSSVAAQEQKSVGRSSPKSPSMVSRKEDMEAENLKDASMEEDTEAENSKDASMEEDMEAEKSKEASDTEDIEHENSKRASKEEDMGNENSTDASNKEDMGAENAKETHKKKICTRQSTARTSRSSKKREATPFFILDPDQCEKGSPANIPNLLEIIDSMRKEREGHNTVYISAPAIGALLERQFPKNRIEEDYYNKPQFSLAYCRDYKPDFSPSVLSAFQTSKGGLESSRIITNPFQDPKSWGTIERENIDKQAPPVFGDLLTDDPCIDFAIKTLMGSIPLGSAQVQQSCYFGLQKM